MQKQNTNITVARNELRLPAEQVLIDVKLLDLLVDVKNWAVKEGYLGTKIDFQTEKPYYTLTPKSHELDEWVHKAELLYHYLIKMPNFAIKEHLLKKSVYFDTRETRTFRVTGKAVRDYGYLFTEGFSHANNADYKGSAWDDDISAGFKTTGSLFNEA